MAKRKGKTVAFKCSDEDLRKLERIREHVSETMGLDLTTSDVLRWLVNNASLDGSPASNAA